MFQKTIAIALASLALFVYSSPAISQWTLPPGWPSFAEADLDASDSIEYGEIYVLTIPVSMSTEFIVSDTDDNGTLNENEYEVFTSTYERPQGYQWP